MPKTYGALVHDAKRGRYVITQAEPHVSIKLKNIFPRIPKGAVPPFTFPDTPQNSADLLWFMGRYPLRTEPADVDLLQERTRAYEDNINELEAIMSPDYTPPLVKLNEGYEARPYQLAAAALHGRQKRLLLGDDMGLGKSVSAILTLFTEGALPAALVVQTHMTRQWKEDFIEKFTTLRVHVIKGTKPYSLPEADVYIFKYSNIGGWIDYFGEGFFKYAIYDEIQDLRREDTLKYRAGLALSNSAQMSLGCSGTPIYNYGDEMFNVLNLLNPGCLDTRDNFLREWCTPVSGGRHHKVDDPQALGTYLRDNFLFLRRTRRDVGRELPPLNKIIHYVDFDEKEVKKSEDRARELAMRYTTGSFVERGQAAQELDMLARYTTGVSKARGVADYVRLLLEAGEPVVLAGWHRDCYDIWLKELADFNPVMYTGTESEKQKHQAVKAFTSGETNLFIISLRSGAGLDGLQHRCKTVVIGELDYSPKVHDQLIARIDRDGQQEQVMVIFLVSESGSDPILTNLLGLKASQAHGIVDPANAPLAQHTDESRIKLLAEAYLSKSNSKQHG